jgi:hypothetical protein
MAAAAIPKNTWTPFSRGRYAAHALDAPLSGNLVRSIENLFIVAPAGTPLPAGMVATVLESPRYGAIAWPPIKVKASADNPSSSVALPMAAGKRPPPLSLVRLSRVPPGVDLYLLEMRV